MRRLSFWQSGRSPENCGLEAGENKAPCNASYDQEEGCPEHHKGGVDEVGTGPHANDAIADEHQGAKAQKEMGDLSHGIHSVKEATGSTGSPL